MKEKRCENGGDCVTQQPLARAQREEQQPYPAAAYVYSFSGLRFGRLAQDNAQIRTRNSLHTSTANRLPSASLQTTSQGRISDIAKAGVFLSRAAEKILRTCRYIFSTAPQFR